MTVTVLGLSPLVGGADYALAADQQVVVFAVSTELSGAPAPDRSCA